MYLMSSDKYECDICGHQERWDEHDDHRGDMWECESCMKHFCTSCFVKMQGRQAFDGMLRNTDYVLCPECFGKNVFNVKDDSLS